MGCVVISKINIKDTNINLVYAILSVYSVILLDKNKQSKQKP